MRYVTWIGLVKFMKLCTINKIVFVGETGRYYKTN